ncbi:MAG: hypothetical protein CFE21_12275 [Bacteroidetes bacterium B1(2017)]|nr:MAG: hypothetical protein CFE21_12275 [Bacteroidetes bacterium B1(2017)]
MEKHYLTISKTARFFTLGELNQNTTHIWLVIHGYAQSAEEFISCFEGLGSNHFIIAPEGLNKFYSRGFTGKPVASWMTSLERDHEISDYCNYLESLVQGLALSNFAGAQVIALGFSQGVSTLTRFINSTRFEPNFQILVAGEIAKEFQENLPQKIAQLKSLYLVGTKENLIQPESIDRQKKCLSEANCSFKTFEGKHEVNGAALEQTLMFIEEKS